MKFFKAFFLERNDTGRRVSGLSYIVDRSHCIREGFSVQYTMYTHTNPKINTQSAGR